MHQKLYQNRKKNKSIQCFFVSSKSSSRTFQSKHQKIDIQKHSIICSFFSNNIVNSTREIVEKLTIISIAKISKLISKQNVEWRFRIVYLFTKLKISRLNFSLNTFVIISKEIKNVSIQKIIYVRTICKFCEQNFNFNEKFFEHIREHEILKRINKIKSIYEITNKSTIACSFHSQKSSNSTKNTSIQRICKKCKQNFNFNNKFHDYIRKHHVRKFVKNLNFRTFASKFTYEIIEKSTNIYLFVSFVSQKSFIFSTTSRNQIFLTKIVSRFVSSNDSSFSIATHEITLKFVKIASINIFFISIATFSTMFRKSISKFHFTIDNLSRMFVENFKLFDLQQYQNRRFFSQNFEFRQFSQLCFSISTKFYFIIEMLFNIFDEKFKKIDLFQNQNNVFF